MQTASWGEPDDFEVLMAVQTTIDPTSCMNSSSSGVSLSLLRLYCSLLSRRRSSASIARGWAVMRAVIYAGKFRDMVHYTSPNMGKQ